MLTLSLMMYATFFATMANLVVMLNVAKKAGLSEWAKIYVYVFASFASIVAILGLLNAATGILDNMVVKGMH